MELVYRGRRYQAKTRLATMPALEISCVYRGVPYKMTHNLPATKSSAQTVQLTYRGISYTRTL